MSKVYEELLSKLYALEASKGMDFKLERIELALHELGDPHLQYPVVHIAGTNGKGSVAAMLHAMLCAAGEQAALYTSPHLVRFAERIRIGADEIAEDQVVQLAGEVEQAARAAGVQLTFFELVTVLAFLHFARRRVPVAVIETGLGGRLDATNVVQPAVTVITSIGFDHQAFLGTTLESIAAEKAGIVKAGIPLIVGEVQPQAAEVIAARAAAQRAPILWAARDFQIEGSTKGPRFSGLGTRIDDLRVGLLGAHQQRNAAVAIAAALSLPTSLRPPIHAIRQGVAEVRWPGRLQIVREQPRVVLDGAHNLQGIAALLAELPKLSGGRTVHLLFGVMRDKPWLEMVQQLAPSISSATVTNALPRRSADLHQVAEAFGAKPTWVIEEPLAALEQCLGRIRSSDLLLVSGSLFLVGAVYPYFADR